MADRSENERLQRLEQDVNQRVREAFTGLREQIGERLRRLSDEALEALAGLGEAELPMVLAAADLELVARDAEGTADQRAAGELLAALSALDRARGQGEVLSALAREARRFAERTAVLLTRESVAELWSAEGWEDAPTELHFAYPPADGWSPATFGRSAVELTGDARGELAQRFDAPAPERAVLVPLVLRDRLAAVLYADDIDRPFPLGASLQVLTWAASQALESLPFRQREATATLAGLGAAEPATEAPALWGSSTTATEGAEDRDHSHGGGRAVGLAAAGLAAAGLAAAGVAKVRHDRREEAAGLDQAVDEVDEVDEAQPADEAGAALEPGPTLADFEDIPFEEGPGPEVAAPPVSLDDDLADGSEVLEDAEPAGTAWSYEEIEEPPTASAAETAEGEEPEEAEVTEEPEEPASFGLDVAESEPPPAMTAGFASEPEVAARAEAEPSSLEPEEETHPATVPIPRADRPTTVPGVAALSPEAADETYPGFGGVMPPPEAPPVAPPRASAAGAEVTPPPDLEGPGRAFAGRAAAPDENQARHDEARRLARLLVSEIRLYNEDEVEAGRRHGDVYERLKEDIDRSRQMYEERVDAGVREGTDYFYQELVRNLGGGDARVLGI